MLKAWPPTISTGHLRLESHQRISMRYLRILIPVFFLTLIFVSCKKEESLQPGSLPATDNGSATEKFLDSTLIDTKDIYLWHNQIPSTFNARSYASPAALMTAIRQYSVEPGFSAPVDRWSFAIDQKAWDDLSAGVLADFGLSAFFLEEGDLRVKSVQGRSAAGLAGVKRGWRITSVNGSNDITTANASSLAQSIYQSDHTSFTFQKPDGSTVSLDLNATPYQENPILLDSVYNVGSKKVGYFVFDSFLGDTLEVYNSFNRIFNRFGNEGVQDVVVDLRYNGGGYVTVAQQLANYLAPGAANGGVMMTQTFNDKYASLNSTDNFQKKGPLNLNRIFFIVSSSTASASELLINSLKPYINVVLLGESGTHGKPVGYFPIPVGSWYIFPVSFYTVNKNGEGRYYNGLPLTHQVADGLDKDWGDLGEASFASAVNYITTGVFRIASTGGRSAVQKAAGVLAGNKVLDAPAFKGAIDLRKTK